MTVRKYGAVWQSHKTHQTLMRIFFSAAGGKKDVAHGKFKFTKIEL